MEIKLLGSITDPKVLENLGFPENTPLKKLLEHWVKVERTYSQNIYRADKTHNWRQRQLVSAKFVSGAWADLADEIGIRAPHDARWAVSPELSPAKRCYYVGSDSRCGRCGRLQ